MTGDQDYEYHINKKPGKTYVSARFGGDLRIASKIIPSETSFHEVKVDDEVVLRATAGGRQEIVAKFFESSRKLFVLTFQRWAVGSGQPHPRLHFSFKDEEIEILIKFLNRISRFVFLDKEKVNIQDEELQTLVATPEHAKAILSKDFDLVVRIAENEITERDIIALGYRRKQLLEFEKLLIDQEYFINKVQGRRPEDVWKDFFEANPWIFGYGLAYIFMDSLDGKKLEQTVRGFSISDSGKRADALMKTRAEISSLCFVENKRHDTKLLSAQPYRPGVWAASQELVGGIAQVQETVRAAIQRLSAPFRPTDKLGEPTGEELYGFEPRSYLVIGRLSEFSGENGLNEDKFRSFEVFRRNVRQPEIITFDELLHRAKFIVNHDSSKGESSVGDLAR